MFDFAQRMQLAVKDRLRGTGLKAGAGLLGAVALGFLLAALWSFLAHELGWGSALASLAVAVLLLVLAGVLVALSKPREPMPTGEDLKREVEARLSLAADIAADRARAEAARVMDMAGNKAHAVMDEASYRASKLANDAERRVFGTVRDTMQAVGLTPERRRDAKRTVRNASASAKRAANSDAGSMAKLIGAFAVGVAIASNLAERRKPRDIDPDDLP